MFKLMNSILVLVLVIFLSACSKDNQDLILGNWMGDQASQSVGSDEELSHYNYLVFSKTDVKLMILMNVAKDDATVKNFDSNEKVMKYEFKDSNQILINNKLYEIDLKKNEMTIKNDNVEIHYLKSDNE